MQGSRAWESADLKRHARKEGRLNLSLELSQSPKWRQRQDSISVNPAGDTEINISVCLIQNSKTWGWWYLQRVMVTLLVQFINISVTSNFQSSLLSYIMTSQHVTLIVLSTTTCCCPLGVNACPSRNKLTIYLAIDIKQEQ